MENLASILRFMQLYAHNAHNMSSGLTFMQDHAYFGDLYPAYEDAYDSIIERLIGLDKEPDLIALNIEAANELQHHGKSDNDGCFSLILQYEEAVCKLIDKIKESGSEGTRQLIGELANQSEMRQYKIKQRLKKS
jgi:DNA-binding ferritin-like protein